MESNSVFHVIRRKVNNLLRLTISNTLINSDTVVILVIGNKNIIAKQKQEHHQKIDTMWINRSELKEKERLARLFSVFGCSLSQDTKAFNKIDIESIFWRLRLGTLWITWRYASRRPMRRSIITRNKSYSIYLSETFPHLGQCSILIISSAYWV